jgi:lipoteichoic acid synthase
VLRELAEQSVVFEHAYVVTPHSSKALVGINCGIAPFPLIQVRESLPGGVPVKCLAALLREQGFQTLYFGSHVADFENWIPLMRNLGFGVSLTADRLELSGFERVNYFAWEDDALLAPTREWLRRARGRRLFAFYLTSTAHHDYRVPSHVSLQPFAADEKHNRYLNAVAYQDAFLGRLLEVYREEGMAERTLFVVLGDHGEAFGEHGLTLHDHVIYDEVIRIPLLLHGAGLAPERREAVVSQLDVLPTVVDLLGFRIRGGSYEGENLFARGPEAVAYISCFYSERCLARVDRRRKLISHFDHGAPEAYAIAEDPRETRDVFGEDPADASRLRELHAWKDQRLGRYLEYYEAQAR